MIDDSAADRFGMLDLFLCYQGEVTNLVAIIVDQLFQRQSIIFLHRVRHGEYNGPILHEIVLVAVGSRKIREWRGQIYP